PNMAEPKPGAPTSIGHGAAAHEATAFAPAKPAADTAAVLLAATCAAAVVAAVVLANKPMARCCIIHDSSMCNPALIILSKISFATLFIACPSDLPDTIVLASELLKLSMAVTKLLCITCPADLVLLINCWKPAPKPATSPPAPPSLSFSSSIF